MSPVQSNPSLQWCLSGASELPSTTCHHHSQQQHTRPSASVTVARIIWWPLTGVEVAAVLSLDTYLACLVSLQVSSPPQLNSWVYLCAKCDALQALKHCKKQWSAKLTFLACTDS